MSEFLTLHEVVKAARQNLSQGAWDYLTGGADTETTLRRNRHGLDRIAFRPRVLRNVTEIDCTGTVLGEKVRLPISLAPMGSLGALNPGGAMPVAQAAEEFGVVSFLSSVTQPELEEIAAATGHPKIYQLYVRGDQAWIEDQIRRAIDNGYKAFCLTVDVAVYSRRERDLIKRYKPLGRRPGGIERQAALTWDMVKWFKDTYDIPLALKGIQIAEDAVTSVEHGVDIVYVTNHGGRQLDHNRATIDMLPEIVEAAAGKAEIIIDGGFMRGSDVVKAMALGANSVAIGKVQGFGLAAAGKEGVVSVLEILEAEIRTILGLLGAASYADLDKTYLTSAPPVYEPHVTSAFPLFESSDWEY